MTFLRSALEKQSVTTCELPHRDPHSPLVRGQVRIPVVTSPEGWRVAVFPAIRKVQALETHEPDRPNWDGDCVVPILSTQQPNKENQVEKL